MRLLRFPTVTVNPHRGGPAPRCPRGGRRRPLVSMNAFYTANGIGSNPPGIQDMLWNFVNSFSPVPTRIGGRDEVGLGRVLGMRHRGLTRLAISPTITTDYTQIFAAR